MPFLQCSIQEGWQSFTSLQTERWERLQPVFSPQNTEEISLKKTKCHKCDKFFVRLDTHLRNSASCTSIPSPPSPSIHSATMAYTTPSHAYLHLPAGEEAMFATPQNSNLQPQHWLVLTRPQALHYLIQRSRTTYSFLKPQKVGRKPMTEHLSTCSDVGYLSSGEQQNPY